VAFIQHDLTQLIMKHHERKTLFSAPNRDLTDATWLVCTNAERRHGFTIAIHLRTRRALLLDSWSSSPAERDKVAEGILEWATVQVGFGPTKPKRRSKNSMAPERPPDLQTVKVHQQDEKQMNCYLFAALYTVMALVACAEQTDPDAFVKTIEGWMCLFDGSKFDASAREWLREAIESGGPIVAHATTLLDQVGLKDILVDDKRDSPDGSGKAEGETDPLFGLAR
jgi:hypothetical protein